MANEEIASFISEQVVKYLEAKLGDSLKNAVVYVRFNEDGAEIDVDVDASILVSEEYLQRVVDEAADLGICIADLVKAKGWPLDWGQVKQCWRD